MKNEIQFLHSCPLPLFSGLEQYALNLVLRQRDLGHKVGMIVLKDSALEKECTRHDIPHFVVDLEGGFSLLQSARYYRDVLRSHPEIEVVHSHTSSDLKRLKMAKLLGAWRTNQKPKVIQQNHIWISHGKNDPLHRFFYSVADEIWCSSEPAKRDLVRFLPVPEQKIKVIRYGRDLQAEQSFLSREDARKFLGVSQEATVLGAIARIDEGKGIWELLNGSLEVMRMNSDLHLVIIGGPTMSDPKSVEFSAKVDSVVSRISDESLRSRIHLKGAIPDAANYLRAFDLYAQVSYKETFSLALLDAQLAGLPVLGTNSGGTPEVVREGKTGWLCEPGNIKSLASSLQRALHETASWKPFGATAQARVRQEFDINHVLDSILAAYRS